MEEKDDEALVKIGLSEFIRAEYGDVIEIVLTKPEDDSEIHPDGAEEPSEDGEFLQIRNSGGDELGVDDLMITVRTTEDRVLINAPFPCKISDLNGDVEDNSDLVNEDAYGDGWCMIVKPFEWDEDMFLNEQEYIEHINEL
tara:strand:+ start:203 stop:625 length:423 start_codon:yes stop_codon:yes gene_type:complete